MRKGLLALVVSTAVTAGAGGLAATAALAADTANRDMHDRMTSNSLEMDALHVEMLEQMPEETRAACTEMHAQMTTQAGDPRDHAAHHDT